MGVFKVIKDKNFTTMSNYHLRDKDLSYKAKGLLSVMLSLPEDWDYSIMGLTTLSTDGKDSVTAAVNELIENGYIIRRQKRNSKGKLVGSEYLIYENPADRPKEAEPRAGKPTTAEPTQQNTKEQNTKELNTNKKEIERKGVVYFENQELNAVFIDYLDMRKKMRVPNTDRAISMLIAKLQQFDDATKIEILNKSILNGWKSVYPESVLKDKAKVEPQHPVSTSAEFERASREFAKFEVKDALMADEEYKQLDLEKRRIEMQIATAEIAGAAHDYCDMRLEDVRVKMLARAKELGFSREEAGI